MCEYTVILFMYKIVRNMCSSVLKSMFDRNNDIHKYVTRHAELLYIPISKTNVLYKTVKHLVVKLWNYIAGTMDYSYAFATFKCQLKGVLSSNDMQQQSSLHSQSAYSREWHCCDLCYYSTFSLLFVSLTALCFSFSGYLAP